MSHLIVGVDPRLAGGWHGASLLLQALQAGARLLGAPLGALCGLPQLPLLLGSFLLQQRAHACIRCGSVLQCHKIHSICAVDCRNVF